MKQHIVVLTGAGISAESGLKTFRDSDGLWNNYRIEEVATPEAYVKNPALVLEFYNMRRREVRKAKPNQAHFALAMLEEKYNVTIVTQNIDDLHERSGSTNVLHLHGEIFKMRCRKHEEEIHPIEGDMSGEERCHCGQPMRPNIVWFGEGVPKLEIAMRIMQEADIFILVGSSLQVYPAAGLIDFVPDATPKYIIDKQIPTVRNISNLHKIEEVASIGVPALAALLLE